MFLLTKGIVPENVSSSLKGEWCERSPLNNFGQVKIDYF